MEMGKGKSQSLVLVVSWSFGSVVGLGETFVPGVIWSQNSLSAHALAAWLAFCFVVSENNPVSDQKKDRVSLSWFYEYGKSYLLKAW